MFRKVCAIDLLRYFDNGRDVRGDGSNASGVGSKAACLLEEVVRFG